MALAEICGMESIDAFRNDTSLGGEVFKFSKNLENHTELAVPPFSNVSFFISTYMYDIFTSIFDFYSQLKIWVVSPEMRVDEKLK